MTAAIRVFSWNIGALSDASNPRAIPEQASAIKAINPDIVFINEALRIGPERRNNQVLALAALTGLNNIEFAVTTDLGIFGFRGQKLVGILSRYPLEYANALPPVCDPIPNGGCFVTLEAQMRISRNVTGDFASS